MSEQTLLDEARLEINSADQKIAVCLKDNFNLVSTPAEGHIPDLFKLSEKVQAKLDEAFSPAELVFTVIKFIDLSI